MTAFGEELVRALARMNSAVFVRLFGQPDERRAVEQLVDGKPDETNPQAARDRLNQVASRQAR